MPACERPALVATDLDGTLLRDDKSVSQYTRDVLRRVADKGIRIVPVTARQRYGLIPIAEAAGLSGLGICANGAAVVDIATGDALLTRPIPADEVARLVGAIKRVDPRVLFATIGPEGEWFRAEADYIETSQFSDHNLAPSEMMIVSQEHLAAECSKVVLRCPGEPATVTLERLRHEMGDCMATTSGAPMVEVMAPGVSKSSTLEVLCARLGVVREQVWAFGDAANDVDMLRWAGTAFAVENACDEVRAVAAHVVGSNEHDGVARQLATLLE